MSDHKCNILIMHDDSSVRRVRISHGFLRIIVYLLIILVLCAGLGGYGAVYFWKENKQLQQENKKLQRTVSQNTVELKRLHNIEKLARKDDKEDIASIVASSLAQKEKHPPRRDINLVDILGTVDKHIVEVSNVQVKFRHKTMKISFDVNKQNDNRKLVEGDVSLDLVTISGYIIMLEAEQNLGFEIRNMKQFRLNIPFPGDCSQKEIFGVRISINYPADNMVFSETYPLSRALL
ncbi:FtsB family cell division protein [Desulfoplanes sp.]